jgi:hypothetical protein
MFELYRTIECMFILSYEFIDILNIKQHNKYFIYTLLPMIFIYKYLKNLNNI